MVICIALSIVAKANSLNFLEKKLHGYLGTTRADLLSLIKVYHFATCLFLFFFFLIYFIYLFLFIYFWLHWVFVAARGLSLVAERGLLFVAVHGLLIEVASLVAEHGL